jgi:membrane protein insertase Oxa1/YidC/SpoIIIJ
MLRRVAVRSSYQLSSASCIAASSLAIGAAGGALQTQHRCINWGTVVNPTKWFGGGGGKKDDSASLSQYESRSTSATLEEELPEIFANQPREVEDYIRPDKSWFEKLEDVWEYIASFFQPVEKQLEIMRSLRHDGLFGFDFGGWGMVFVFYGFILRAITLIPSLYSNRNALRMGLIGTQLSEITNSQNRIKADKTLSSAEKRIAKEGLVRMKSALCSKHGCAQWKSFAQGVTAPITLSAFMSVRRLSVYETDLEKSSFLWVTDLTLPDPTFVLPMICASMFVMNFELNQRMQRGGRSATGMYLRWVVRGGAFVFVYFFSAQPSAMFAYWIGLSLAGCLQPMMLRNQRFRDFFGFPDPPQLVKDSILRSEIKGPSLMERIFASQEDKLKQKLATEAALKKLKEKKFEKIDSYEVVFDEPSVAAGASKAAQQKK